MVTGSVRVSAAALLFDLDGTLADSGDSVVEAWTILAQRHGLDAERILAICHGRRTAEVLEQVAPDLDTQAAVVETESLLGDLGARPTQGSVELLDSLPAGAWAVVTSSTRALALRRFEPPTGLPAASVLITADDVARGKPDPSCYMQGADQLGVPANDCIVIEDAPAGVAAGQTAGAAVIAVLSTHSREELAAADYIVDDLRQVRVASAVRLGRGWHIQLDVG